MCGVRTGLHDTVLHNNTSKVYIDEIIYDTSKVYIDPSSEILTDLYTHRTMKEGVGVGVRM